MIETELYLSKTNVINCHEWDGKGFLFTDTVHLIPCIINRNASLEKVTLVVTMTHIEKLL